MTDLQPCPFCGGAASKNSYDRGIDIGCEPCGYSRHFPGLLQTVRNDKPIAQYRNGAGGITEIPASEATEFYHADADERAVEAWNSRAGAQNAEAIRNAALEEAASLLEQKFNWSAARAPIGEACDAIRALQSGTATTQEGGAA